MGKSDTGIAKHLFVISYDGFSEDNWETAKGLPNMSKLLGKGAFSTSLRSVYPSLTYVVHSTMVTGVYPDKHGVNHNNPLQPFVEEKNQRWHWFRDSIKAPTIYDSAKEANMRTAGILWPVTGKSSIRYNMPEIAAINGENQALKVFKNGSPFYCVGMELKYGRVRRGIEQPYLDDFSTLCAVDTIKRKKPHLMLVHLIDLDDAKHRYGTDSLEVHEVIKRMDKRLGDMVKAAEQAGIEKETVFIIVGDHGHMDVSYKVHLNNLLEEHKLIDSGSKKWRAYFQGAGGSAYLHVKQDDKDAEKLAVEILEKVMKEDKYGLESFYSRDELDGLHVDKSIRYMVEGKKGYSFDDSLSDRTIEDLERQGIKYATHGYLPDKDNYKCNLIISGEKIRNEYQLGNIEMVDLAPTMGKILGIPFTDCDGRSLDELFAGVED